MKPENVMDTLMTIILLILAIAIVFLVHAMFMPHNQENKSDMMINVMEWVIFGLIVTTYVITEVFNIKTSLKSEHDQHHEMKWKPVLILIVAIVSSVTMIIAARHFLPPQA